MILQYYWFLNQEMGFMNIVKLPEMTDKEILEFLRTSFL